MIQEAAGSWRRLAHLTLAGAVHTANSATRTLDLRLFSPPEHADPGPVFIVGAPRSGSTLTFQVLTQALRVTYLPRLLDFSYGFSNLALRLLRNRLESPPPSFASHYGKVKGQLSPSEAIGFWMRWFHKGHAADHSFPIPLAGPAARDLQNHIYALQGHLNAPLLVKCLYLSLAVPALAAAIPNSRFVFIRRDPLSIATSMLRARQRQAARTWWSTRPPGFQEKLGEPLAEQVTWQVSEILRIVGTSLAGISSDRWHSLDFEDLCRSPPAAAETLCCWLGPRGYERRKAFVLPEHFEIPPSPNKRELELLATTRSFAALMAHKR